MQQVTVNGAAFKWVRVKSGVLQGTVLGPLLFLTFINNIGTDNSSTLRLFADDCLLYRVIDSAKDVEILQHDLNLITEWCKCWFMKLNLDKYVTLQCYITLSPVLSNYVIEGHTPDNVNQHHYLGMIYLIKLCPKFTAHINNTVSKHL